jgi:hypothetical protein
MFKVGCNLPNILNCKKLLGKKTTKAVFKINSHRKYENIKYHNILFAVYTNTLVVSYCFYTVGNTNNVFFFKKCFEQIYSIFSMISINKTDEYNVMFKKHFLLVIKIKKLIEAGLF